MQQYDSPLSNLGKQQWQSVITKPPRLFVRSALNVRLPQAMDVVDFPHAARLSSSTHLEIAPDGRSLVYLSNGDTG